MSNPQVSSSRPPMANNLGRIRKICRLSQSDVAFLLPKYLGRSIDFTTVSAHENARRHLDQDEIIAYARLYKVPSRLLFINLTTESELVNEMMDYEKWEWPLHEQYAAQR